MTERLLVALALLAAVVALALLTRATATRRYRRRAAEVSLAANAAGLPRVLTFSTAGGGACGTQRRVLDAVVAARAGGVEVDHVDAVAEPELARRFGVVTVPTTVVAAPDGRVVAINGGLADADRLRRQLDAAVA